MVFRVPATGNRVTIWYSADEGYLTVKATDVDARGNLVGELAVDRVVSVKDDAGNTFFYPASGSRRSIVGGRTGSSSKLVVDDQSIKVNAVIAPDRFEIVPGPNERIFDSDLKMIVRDPEKPGPGLDALLSLDSAPAVPIAGSSPGTNLPSDAATTAPAPLPASAAPSAALPNSAAAPPSQLRKWLIAAGAIFAAGIVIFTRVKTRYTSVPAVVARSTGEVS